MNYKDKRVYHKNFGFGVVTNQNDENLSVKFLSHENDLIFSFSTLDLILEIEEPSESSSEKEVYDQLIDQLVDFIILNKIEEITQDALFYVAVNIYFKVYNIQPVEITRFTMFDILMLLNNNAKSTYLLVDNVIIEEHRCRKNISNSLEYKKSNEQFIDFLSSYFEKNTDTYESVSCLNHKFVLSFLKQNHLLPVPIQEHIISKVRVQLKEKGIFLIYDPTDQIFSTRNLSTVKKNLKSENSHAWKNTFLRYIDEMSFFDVMYYKEIKIKHPSYTGKFLLPDVINTEVNKYNKKVLFMNKHYVMLPLEENSPTDDKQLTLQSDLSSVTVSIPYWYDNESVIRGTFHEKRDEYGRQLDKINL